MQGTRPTATSNTQPRRRALSDLIDEVAAINRAAAPLKWDPWADPHSFLPRKEARGARKERLSDHADVHTGELDPGAVCRCCWMSDDAILRMNLRKDVASVLDDDTCELCPEGI